MRVLFLADPAPDYVADGLLHGLRSLLGADVVDVPRRAPLYRSSAAEASYGHGFGLYGLLDEVDVDRDTVWEREWDLVVSAVMWRDWDWWVRAWGSFDGATKHAAVDGGDLRWAYPYGPAWLRPGRLFLPRTRRRATYFKREWSTRTHVAAGRRLRLEPIAISYPAEKLVEAVGPKSQDFGSHIVDLEVGEALGRRLEHGRQLIFKDEAEYLADLRASRFGVTTRRAGWDALRHYEIAAAGAVPAFRDLADKPATCAPHGLVAGVNCIAYGDAVDLLRQTGAKSDEQRAELAESALAWARENTTRARAQRFLERALP